MVRLLLCCWRRSQVARREAGSIPDVGSSSITTWAWEMGAGQNRSGSDTVVLEGVNLAPTSLEPPKFVWGSSQAAELHCSLRT